MTPPLYEKETLLQRVFRDHHFINKRILYYNCNIESFVTDNDLLSRG